METLSLEKCLGELKEEKEWINLLYSSRIIDILNSKKDFLKHRRLSFENGENINDFNSSNNNNKNDKDIKEVNQSKEVNENQLLSFSSHHTNVGDALRLLSQYHLFACPVFNEDDNGCENQKVYNYVGMLGIHEIVEYLLGCYKDRKKINSVVGVIHLDTWIDNKHKLIENTEFFKITPVIDILKLVRNKTSPTQLYLNDSLAVLIRVLTNSSSLRLPVINNDNIVGLVSTSDVLRILVENQTMLPKIFFKSIESLSHRYKLIEEFPKIRSDQPTTAAFDLLERENKPSLLVIDSNTNHVLANFSLSDLKVLVEHNIEDLMLPINEFIRNYKPIVSSSSSSLSSGNLATFI
ncbi:hypothetical protein PPL_10134 [Heterostelium album PN500]|uniref:CBS domain-containing protein n=1 Tax=Heterostelium pallidum (strain ATCC 26659 / Pp 5 / PN500) TaxID=670386 RepID=D3BQE9_HETP5|nr:hypothetical protein PPL_10134 [Heterostelium album PN500]EFA76369.1 hypothetical protein PPL_10134 [Heterostelium album PN500]|eukprot:XP_020428501.1 hypothetical protein PPL_10134 [Heterostelium album PN500]